MWKLSFSRCAKSFVRHLSNLHISQIPYSLCQVLLQADSLTSLNCIRLPNTRGSKLIPNRIRVRSNLTLSLLKKKKKIQNYYDSEHVREHVARPKSFTIFIRVVHSFHFLQLSLSCALLSKNGSCLYFRIQISSCVRWCSPSNQLQF